jgi:hypothetical protein
MNKKGMLLRTKAEERKKQEQARKSTPDTYNGRRKELYEILSHPEKLREGNVSGYQVVRSYIIEHNPQAEQELPVNPLNPHYDLARKLLSDI